MYTPTHNATYAYVCANTYTLLCKYLYQFWICTGFSSWKRHPCCIQKTSLFSIVIVAWRFQVRGDATNSTDYLALEKNGVSLVPSRKYFRKCAEEAQSQNTLLSIQFLFNDVKSDINLAILSDILLLRSVAKINIFVSQSSSHPDAYSEHHLIQMFPAKSRCHMCGIGLHITCTLI